MRVRGAGPRAHHVRAALGGRATEPVDPSQRRPATLWPPPPRVRSGSLRTYLITRLLLVIPMVWILVTLVFFVMRVIGDPIAAGVRRTGCRRPRSPCAGTRAGLDKPLLTQYWHYLDRRAARRLRQDAHRQPAAISHIIVVNGAATLELTFWALLVALVVGIPLGRRRGALPRPAARRRAAAVRRALLRDAGVLPRVCCSSCCSRSSCGWFYRVGPGQSGRRARDQQRLARTPTSTSSTPSSTATPPTSGTCSGTPCCRPSPSACWSPAIFLRLVRVNLLQTLRADYVEAARARGVPERRVVRKHAFRNALIPVVTVMGLQIAVAARRRRAHRDDLRVAGPRLQAGLLPGPSATTSPCRASSPSSRSIVALISFLIDVIAAVIDPRVRY